MNRGAYGFRRGTALVMGIVISLVVTGLIVTMAYVAGVQAQSTGNLSKTDQAYFAAESGIQRVAWYIKSGTLGSITSPISGTVNGYAYSTSWASGTGMGTDVTSVGSLGSVSSRLSATVAPPQPAALTTLSDFNNKNITVAGDILVGGNYTNSSGSGSLTGSLTYYGTASDLGSMTGTIIHATGSLPAFDFTALGSTLSSAAQVTYTGLQSNKTFDFTALTGSNKVIYVNGNVTNPTFIGSGTLYVNGTVSVSDFGSSGNPVHIAATGDITTTNNVHMYGSIYSPGNWNRGSFTLTGMLYIAGVIQQNNGNSDLVQTAAPWFDPRMPANGGSTPTTFTKFAGIAP